VVSSRPDVTERTTEQWLAEVFGPEPSAAPPVQTTGNSEGHAVNLDATEEDPPSREESTPDVNAGAKKTAMMLGAGLVLALAVVVAALVIFGASPPPPSPQRPAPVASVAPSVPPSAGAAPADQDQAIPFAASANCPAGSTSAQALSEAASDSAWVCVRGGVDGQVLRVDLGKSYVLTAVSVTPGWVAKTPGGKDEWLAHRVVSRLQYMFNDADRTIVAQDTGNTHGPVLLPLRKILASRVTVIVLQTSRPPADPVPTTAAGPGGFLDSVLGAGGAPPAPDAAQTSDPMAAGEQGSDPVDATFAMSELKFLGHQPN
jgi:hypothetical protein